MHKKKAEKKPKRKPAPEQKPKERMPEMASPPPQREKPLPPAEEPKPVTATPAPAPEPPKSDTPPPVPEPPATAPETRPETPAAVTEARLGSDETIEQRREPAMRTAAPAAPAEQTVKREPEAPVAPPPVESEKTLPSARAAGEQETQPIEPVKTAAPGKRRHWWIIAAIVAALLLLGLLLFNWRTLSPGPEPTTRPRPEAGEPAREQKQRTRPPVKDIETEETAPVDKPAAPAQPPD